MNYLLYAIISVLLGGLGQVLWKIGLRTVDFTWNLSQFVKIITNVWIFSGLLCYFISLLFWWVAIKQGPISQIYPLTAINFILLTVVGYFLFGEVLRPLGLIGITFIIIGVVTLAYSTSP